MVELEKLFCAFIDKKTPVVMRSLLIFDVLHWADEQNFGETWMVFRVRTGLWLDEKLLKNSVTLTFCQTVIRTIMRMLEVPSFKIIAFGAKIYFRISLVLSFSIGTLETISEYRMDVFWKSFWEKTTLYLWT